MWNAFLDYAIEYLRAQNERLEKEFGLGGWQRYDYDLEAGTIIFSSYGRIGVIADVYVVGTTAKRGGTWLWSWANPSILLSAKHCMEEVREYGEENGFDRLTTACWPGDEQDGWEMTAAAAVILKAQGGYRAPDEKGALFMILQDVRWPG